jgi:hypothetical protein
VDCPPNVPYPPKHIDLWLDARGHLDMKGIGTKKPKPEKEYVLFSDIPLYLAAGKILKKRQRDTGANYPECELSKSF